MPRFIFTLTIVLFFYMMLGNNAFGKALSQCVTETFNDISMVTEIDSFIPEEHIYIKISCGHLPKGKYTVHVNWNKENYGTVRYHKQEFNIESPGSRMVYFWMKLSQKKLLDQALIGSNFSNSLIGNWHVESFLNDETIGKNHFIIN